jgi:integrase/recombinase XerD
LTGYTCRPMRGHLSILRSALERHAPVPRNTRFSRADLQRIFVSSTKPRRFRTTQRVFERFLRSCGQWLEEPRTGRYAALLDAYRRHLLEMRGLSVTTADQHIAVATAFLKHAVSLSGCLADLSAHDIERFVAITAERVGRSSLQNQVGSLRSFLRFCHDRGELRARLDAIDMSRKYRAECPPRAIPWDLTERLLLSIDLSTPLGQRDHAVLYLMAHYGLRTGEIAALKLESIDWPTQTLRVEQSKTRSVLVLPLTDPAAGVLKRYLHKGRPPSDRPELFLCALAPVGPLTPTTISQMFQRRVRQSGLPLAGSSPYGLRHGFAMRLLERNVGVKAIGDLLGHRTLESTCVYLRLHTEALRDVGLPLPSRPKNGGRLS